MPRATSLRNSWDPQAIGDIAHLVTIGLILGFVVKGEIALGGDVGVFTNLAGERYENTRAGTCWPGGNTSWLWKMRPSQ